VVLRGMGELGRGVLLLGGFLLVLGWLPLPYSLLVVASCDSQREAAPPQGKVRCCGVRERLGEGFFSLESFLLD
jgi:hypothetical protein